MILPVAPFAAGPEARPAADALAGTARAAFETLRAGEEAAAGAIAGTVDAREAVDRVMEAERTLRAAVAIRDKLVAGWLDVSRMTI